MNINAKEIFQYCLAGLIVLCFFASLIMILFYEIPEANKDAVNIMLGVTGTITVGVCNYFFASSLGSSKKTDIIANNKKLK